MSNRPAWFERQFTFDLPVAASAGLLERLRGTPARIEDRVEGLEPARITARLGDRWSIQENIGHLWDLEPLWGARMQNFMDGKKTLHPADLENRQTHSANHNARPLRDLLAGFRSRRHTLVTKLEGCEDNDWLRSALHPRLQTSMRMLDLAYFVAEHDDHHLATISELLRQIP